MGITDLYQAVCKEKCAKCFKKYRHIMNNVERANANNEKEFADWLE